MERKKAVRFGAALAMTRLLQWLLAFVSYRFFRKGFSENARATWDMDAGVNAVPVLNIVTLVYASLAVVAVFAACRLPPSRRFRVELVSLPVDLGFAIVLLVKSTLLNNTRLDCHGLLQEKFLGGNSREASIAKRVLGLLSRLHRVDDIDRQCAASLFVYWISLLTIASYMLSMFLTMNRCRDYRMLYKSEKKSGFPGHVELAVDHMPQSSASSFRSPGYPAEEPYRLERQSSASPALLSPVTHRPQPYQETPSQVAAAFVVSDGFRPTPDPSAYSSKPASPRSCKGD